MLDPNTAYQSYQEDPSPQNLRKVVDALSPVIDYNLSSLNSANDPHMRNMARVYAGKAIQKYDPAYGADLKTWTTRQLQPLKRLRRQTQQVLKIPERIQLDGYHLSRSAQAFEDRMGREPDLGELSEEAKLPLKRIKQIKEYSRKVGVDSPDLNSPEHESVSFTDEALDYIFDESDHVDRVILQHKLGYNGAEVLPTEAIKAKLNLTDSQLSRRSSRISMKLLKMESDLEKMMG